MSIRDFFLSWGLDAENDDSEIPEAVYNRMWGDAFFVGGEKLQAACARFVNAVDGMFYLKMPWEDIERVYESM